MVITFVVGVVKNAQKKANTFCSKACVHHHRIRSQPGFRKCLLTRDKGVCAICHLNAHAIYRSIYQECRKIKSIELANEKLNALLKDTPLHGANIRARKGKRRPVSISSGLFWHADHIKMVAQGGGLCGLDNFRTLCIKCHKSVTKQQHKELPKQRKAAKLLLLANNNDENNEDEINEAFSDLDKWPDMTFRKNKKSLPPLGES